MQQYVVRRLSDDKILFEGVARKVYLSGTSVWIDVDDRDSVAVSLVNTSIETREIKSSDKKVI